MAKRKPVKIAWAVQPQKVAERMGLSKSSYADIVKAVGKIPVQNRVTGQVLSLAEAMSMPKGTVLFGPKNIQTNLKPSKISATKSRGGGKSSGKGPKGRSGRIAKGSRK